MVGSDDLKKGLSQLIEVLYSRLPEGKTVTVAVVKQLLRQRYSDKFSSEFLEEQSSFIESEMVRCAAAFQSKAGLTAKQSSDHSDRSSEDEEDEESDDEDEENSDEEDEEDEDEEDSSEEGSSSEEDSGTDGSSENDQKEDHGNTSASNDPKKSRKREREGGDESPTEENKATKVSTMAIVGMPRCLKKLRYDCRGRLSEESTEQYLSYLTEEFHKHKLDPQQYDDKAIKRYNMLREVELLQADGATLQLDRSKRVGRGYSVHLNQTNTENDASPPPPAKFVSSKFLDEEE